MKHLPPKTNAMIRAAYNEIRRVIEMIGREHKYEFILQVGEPEIGDETSLSVDQQIKNRVILYQEAAIDITDAVIKQLNGASPQIGHTSFTIRASHPEIEILVKADRLWSTDDEESIRLYNRLLTEFGQSETVQRHRTRITRRAEQKD